ncbi:conjugal transfer protein MobA [Odoribacter sp. AF15-53]|uniref:conjugal transfer protein MobA n=1 Tax=Odoribacter sp. AF15-53 TaxID=2292236 RepID=UPI000E5296CF|nr:conjugal transfer protein MobA [Odoribacter sp. AF15-53]RHR74948.1 hypothetical protein DWW52_18885 [Odoribacter sp. AF15-53]
MKNKNSTKRETVDPATYRYYIRLNAADNTRFLTLMEQTGMTNKSKFIVKRIFSEPFRVLKIDKSAHDYYSRLTNIFAQFRSIGVNYNQVVKVLNTNFSENKARVLLFKLEKETIQLIKLSQQIINLTQDFENKYMNHDSEN